MTLDGNYTLNAPRETIWDLLMDPEVLARITPGITSLEKIDDDNYKAVAQIKVGPVGGAFSGSLGLTDRKKPESFSISIQQNSKIGNANAVVHLTLAATDAGQTAVHYTGDVKLSGMLSTMGGRVITPVVKMLSEQFFEALEKEAVGLN